MSNLFYYRMMMYRDFNYVKVSKKRALEFAMLCQVEIVQEYADLNRTYYTESFYNSGDNDICVELEYSYEHELNSLYNWCHEQVFYNKPECVLPWYKYFFYRLFVR